MSSTSIARATHWWRAARSSKPSPSWAKTASSAMSWPVSSAQRADVALSPATANVSTWEVRWTEQSWNLSGDPGAQTHWEAELTVTLTPPAELDGAAAENPLGFTVEEISWTQGR